MLTEHANKGNKQERMEIKKSISAREYHNSLQDFDFNLYMKVFSGVLPQARELLDIM